MEHKNNQEAAKATESKSRGNKHGSRFGRNVTIVFALILVLLGGLLASLPFLFKYQAEAWYARQGNNQQLVVGNVDIGLFSGKVGLEGISARKNGKLVFAVKSINGVISLDHLLKGKLDFGALSVVGLKIAGTSGHDGLHLAGISLPLTTIPGVLLLVSAFQSLEMTDGAIVWDADDFSLQANIPSMQVGAWSPSSGLETPTIKAELSVTHFSSTINNKEFELTQPADLIVAGSVLLSDTGLTFDGGFEAGSIVIQHPSAEGLVSRLESLKGDGLTLQKGELFVDKLSFSKAESWLLGTIVGANQVKSEAVSLDKVSVVKDKLTIANAVAEQLQIRNHASQMKLLSVVRSTGDQLSISPDGFNLKALQLSQPALLAGDGTVEPLMGSEQILVANIRGKSTAELPTADTIELEGLIINYLLNENGKLALVQNSGKNKGEGVAGQGALLVMGLLIRVGKSSLIGTGELHFQDISVNPPVRLDATIGRLSSEIDSDQGRLQMVLRGEIGQYGTYSADLDLVGIENGGSGKVTIAVRELDLPPFGPYLDKFVGIGFQAGMLDLNTTTEFNKGRFKGVIEFDLTHLEFGQQGLFDGHSQQSGLSMPLQTLLLLFGQGEREMKLSVPLQGNLHNPKFNFWNILTEGVVKMVIERLSQGIKGVGGVNGSNPMGIFGLIPNMARIDGIEIMPIIPPDQSGGAG